MIAISKKIKIIYYIPQLTIGGSEKHLLDLVTRLDKQKYEPVVWCPRPWGEIGDELLNNNIKVITYKIPYQLLNFALYLRRNNYDIFHSYGYATHYIDAVIAKLSGIPIYISSRENIRHWQGGDKLHITERIRNKFTNIVIAVSNAAKNKSIEIEHIPDKKIKVIYNAIDLSKTISMQNKFLIKQKLGIPNDYLIIGNVANLKPIKGQKYLLHAFARVRQKKENIKLLIIGKGPEEPNLLQMAKELNIADDVIITYCNHDIISMLNIIDIFTLPSLAEGLPLALLEAMAMRIPSIVSNVGGMPELVFDNKTGFIVESKDINGLAEAITTLIENPQLRSIFGNNAKQKIEKSFSLETMIQEFETVYEDLIANKYYAEYKTQR